MGSIRRLASLLSLLLCSSALLVAAVGNMSGKWSLNTKRSDWGKKPSPVRVDLVIEHNEPAFKYSGTIQAADEREPASFEFSGAIDEKEHAVKEHAGERKARFKRTSDNTIEGVYIGPDGKIQETTKTTLSRDGKTLTRTVRIKLPDGRISNWTEVYEKGK